MRPTQRKRERGRNGGIVVKKKTSKAGSCEVRKVEPKGKERKNQRGDLEEKNEGGVGVKSVYAAEEREDIRD